MSLRQALSTNGYAVVRGAINLEELASIERALQAVPVAGAGTRNLLGFGWCRALVQRLRCQPLIAGAIPAPGAAIQCTLFDKTPDRNWLVAYHQDLSVPVQARVEHPQLGAWSLKEGRHFVQPPEDLLAQLVAVRLHIDECGLDNGPLRVLPGSHLRGRIPESELRGVRAAIREVPCPVEKGGALLFKPLLLHASSKAVAASRRRVLHFLFAPTVAGYGLRWQHAV